MTENEKRNLISLLDQIVMSAAPRATTVKKYGGTLYTVHPEEKEGQFCGIFAYQSHVQLSFARGTDLDDPNGLLQGKGTYRRHLNFKSVDDLNAKVIRQFVKSSAKL